MLHTSKEGRYTDRRDDYRNGFVDAIVHLRHQYPPTDEQIESAVVELHRFRRTASACTPDAAVYETSYCSHIDALRR